MRPVGRRIGSLGLLALIGCGGPKAESVVSVRPVVGSELATLTLAVPDEAVEGEPRCDDRVRDGFGANGVHLSLVWGEAGKQTRRVTARFDTSGLPLEYSDVRGGLGNMRTMGQPVPGTMIILDWMARTALVGNQDERGARSDVRVDFEEALVSETLGRPSDVVRRMREMCSSAEQASDFQ